jgi:hypothetical protein
MSRRPVEDDDQPELQFLESICDSLIAIVVAVSVMLFESLKNLACAVFNVLFSNNTPPDKFE